LTAATAKPQIDVAAGVLFNSAGSVLVAQRPAGTHQAGWWEFPGGKLAAGETPLQGLIRELQEELGIEVLAAQALLQYRHEYPERSVELHIWRVTEFIGEPIGLEGQPIKWVAVAELATVGLLPGDEPIIAALASG
jgi:8-oxo-dGTP diphosphatase